MKDYAPNCYALMGGGNNDYYNPRFKAESKTPEGNYYGFKNLSIGSYKGFAGLYIRKDMLDSRGLDIPVTIDDRTIVLQTAKNQGVSPHLTGSNSLFGIAGSNSNTNIFNGA